MSQFDHDAVKGVDEGDEEALEDEEQVQDPAQVAETVEDVSSSEEE